MLTGNVANAVIRTQKTQTYPLKIGVKILLLQNQSKHEDFGKRFSELLRSIPNHTGNNATLAAESCHFLRLVSIPVGVRLNGKWNAGVAKGQ